ncbi:MAG: putative membrane protein YphA (DoxX/SURF4 family) [Glaciecola sp.]|jgi:uncharacterized membrane protein YphA (DoxX/SURF4 family)
MWSITMNTALWIAQIVLGLAFVGAGVMKATKSRAELKEKGFDYVEDLSDGGLKAIGVVEILAGIGLILPPAVDVLPILAGIAAAGLVIVMLGAIALHIRRKEYMPSLLVNGVLGGAALFIAVGRLGAQAF